VVAFRPRTNRLKGSEMSRKAAASAPKAPVTREVVARTMAAVAPKHGGKIPAGSYVGRLQSRASTAAGSKKAGHQ
jgi:hypothetical protein